MCVCARPRVCVCVCICLWYMCRRHWNCYVKSARKCSVSVESVPKEYLRSPITALPLFHCHYANVIAVKQHLPLHFDTVPIRTDFHHLYTILFHTILYPSLFFFLIFFSTPKRAKNVEIFNVEIHFAYHSKYLYSFVENLELLTDFQACKYAGQPKKALCITLLHNQMFSHCSMPFDFTFLVHNFLFDASSTTALSRQFDPVIQISFRMFNRVGSI